MESTSQKLQSEYPQLIVLILKEPDLLEAVLDLWEAEGVTGTTVLECLGRSQLRAGLQMDDLPLFPALSDFMRIETVGQKLIFSVIADPSVTKRVLKASQKLLEEAHAQKGLLFTLPVGIVYGLGQTSTP
jgi:nitrogen regulatory protein PII